MPLLLWTGKYSVNIRDIDAQHQQLFALLNELYDAIQAGTGKAVIGDVLDKLLDYTQYHFAGEEALFAQYDWPEAAAHRAEHAALTYHTRTLLRRYAAGEMGVPAETLRFLADWLRTHIVGSDMRYVEYLNERGAH